MKFVLEIHNYICIRESYLIETPFSSMILTWVL